MKIIKLWISLCSDRAHKYKKLSNVVATIQNYHVKVDSYSQYEAITNIRSVFEARKNDDKMNSKAEAVIRKSRKHKLFKILMLNTQKNKKFKKGVKTVEAVLQDQKNKLYAIKTLELVFKRENALKTVIKTKIENTRLLDK